MPPFPWRSGVREVGEASVDGDVILLDAAHARFVRLRGDAAATVRGETTARAAEVAATLRALGLVDARGASAGFLSADRRLVLRGAGAAALGISVLVLPGAAAASSGDAAWTSVGDGALGLELARAVLGDPDDDAGSAYLAGGVESDAVLARMDRDSGELGEGLVLATSGAVHYPTDLVRIGDTAYVLVLEVASRYAEAFEPYANVWNGGRLVEVQLDGAVGEDARDGMVVLRSTAVEAMVPGDVSVEEIAFFPGCLATAGGRLYLSGTLRLPSAEGDGQVAAVVFGEVDLVTLTLATAPAVLFETGDITQPTPVPLAAVVEGDVACLWLQTPDYLDIGPEALGLVALIDLGQPGDAPEAATGGPVLAIDAVTTALTTLPPRPAPVVFADNLYVAVNLRHGPDSASGFGAVAVVRIDLTADGIWDTFELDDPVDPTAPDWDGTAAVPEVVVVQDGGDFPLPFTLSRSGGSLVVSTDRAVHRVPLGPGGALPLAQDVIALAVGPEELVPTAVGVSPVVPTIRAARAFFGTGKGKSDLIEVTI